MIEKCESMSYFLFFKIIFFTRVANMGIVEKKCVRPKRIRPLLLVQQKVPGFEIYVNYEEIYIRNSVSPLLTRKVLKLAFAFISTNSYIVYSVVNNLF